MSPRRDVISPMDLFPIKTRIMNVLRPKDEPPGVCPQCDEDDASPREAVMEWLRGLGHTEDEAREIEQRMAGHRPGGVPASSRGRLRASEVQLIASRLAGVASAIKRRPRSVAHAVPRQGQERMIGQ